MSSNSSRGSASGSWLAWVEAAVSSKDVARDVVWAMNSPEFYRLLVVGRGWSGEMFESQLADAWQRLLLEEK